MFDSYAAETYDLRKKMVIRKATLFIHGLCLKLEACGAVCMKQRLNIKNITWLNIPTGRRQTSWLFTSMTEELNSGQPRTNPDCGQNGT